MPDWSGSALRSIDAARSAREFAACRLAVLCAFCARHRGDQNGVGMVQSPDRERAPSEPATLYRVMQEAIGAGLQKLYEPEHEVPHHLFVLMMQINEDRRRASLRV